MPPPRIALLGFLPWSDPARQVTVRENPAALAAERCARGLTESGMPATFVPVPVSGEGIFGALESIESVKAEVVVALGQTTTEPRVERFGRVPGDWSPAESNEDQPWLLAPDAELLATILNARTDPAAKTLPFRVSDDAGGYFCDHLCVELVRASRQRALRARFLHVTAIDGCPDEVREARIAQYAQQARATAVWLVEDCLADRGLD